MLTCPEQQLSLREGQIIKVKVLIVTVLFGYRAQNDAQRAGGAPLLPYDFAQVLVAHSTRKMV